ncbi:Protein FAR1-RELATED SEQUENCE 5, partial [Linum grandiflorum]
MLQIAGGAANVGFTIGDLRNHQRLPRSQFLDSADLTMMLKHFREKARVDKNLYYEMSEHADGEILSVFWADGRMRSDYASFGDAVSFDTTYRTNRECRPLAIFVGFNHHRQLIIFGAALLFDEKTETFEWLFDTFLKCMGGKKPKSIFTDQAAAIAAGIRTHFPLPDTYHGLCTFHIHENA